jgi:tetratricopeptide (TPR) repeat protein
MLAYQREDLSEEEAKQVQATERFLKVLEKSPRRGTALDRVYGHHVEFGTLDRFMKQLRDRVEKDARDDAAWMLIGLFEAQRGADAVAAEAFQQASTLRPTDAMAAYYWGQALLRIGQTNEAVAAFEQAIQRKPPRNDLLEIFQQLGRVHQRAQRTEEAIKVWQRLEALFPEDPRVLEQIAVTLADEGGFAQALPRYEQLAKLVKDDYRRVLFRVEAAGLKIKTNRRDEGVADMEAVLQDLNPDSWLYRDVRRRIENVFLKSGDQDSLVKYYEKWLETHAADVEAMARLARFLASSARIPEATTWMEKALQLAPSRSDLRKAFIDQLVDEQRIPEAVQQYEQLIKASPANSDLLRDWGKLVLKDKTRDIEDRKRDAMRIWNQIIAIRPNDATTVAQVADLCRQANLVDLATDLYRKAVDLSPNDPQYREYLGEYLNIQKRPEEALAVWKSIAEGTRRNAANITRLAEVFNSFGFNQFAATEIAEACQLTPKEFSLQLRSADYHMRADKMEEALQFLKAAEALAVNADERSAVIKQRIEVLQASQRMATEIESRKVTLQADPQSNAEQWHVLAMYQESERLWPDASESIQRALDLDDKSIPILTTAAKISESSGDLGRAATLHRKLAAVDRRSQSDHLMNVARLEAQLGRSDQALQAAQELIIAAPGNTDNYEFLAQMCFRLGKSDEGLEALRKAVRINPNEPHLIMALGNALADQVRTDEAIEVFWRAFEKSEELDDKTSLVTKLVPLYLQINQFDKLVERLERDRREEEKRRVMTICLAQAHNQAGDYGTARQELESLLSKETRDTNLLQQLAKLCEGGGDMEAAIGYQRQLVGIAPGSETEFPLAKMLLARGERDEATEILVKLTRREEDPVKLLRSIDSLLQQSSLEAAISITEPLLSQQRDDWEMLYREGVAWAMLNKRDEAAVRFQRILALNLPHDAMGQAAAERFKQAQAKAKSDNLRGATTQAPQRQSPLSLLGSATQIQRAVGLSNDVYYSSASGPPPIWAPDYFCLARMASIGWLLKFEEDAKSESTKETKPRVTTTNNEGNASESPRFDEILRKSKDENATPEQLYDALYACSLKSKYAEILPLARRLAKRGDNESKAYFLRALQTRNIVVDPNQARSSNAVGQTKAPLTEEDLALMLSCYESLQKAGEASVDAIAAGGQVIYSSNGQAYVNVGGQFVAVGSGGSFSSSYIGLVYKELQGAGRAQQATELLQKAIEKATMASRITPLMGLLFDENQTESLNELYQRWADLAKQEIAKASTATPVQRNRGGINRASPLLEVSNTVMRWMGKLGPEEEHAQILRLLDPALEVAIDHAKQRRAERTKSNPRMGSGVQTQSSTYYNYFYGKESVSARVDFPKPNDYVDATTLQLLRQVYEVFKRNDVAGDLPAHLRKRVDKAADADRVYEQLILSVALWWNEDQQDAADLMAKASEALKDDLAYRFEMASMREMLGDFEDAMEIVESIAPRDQQVLQRKEWMALQLAERLGDNERAIAAAEKLFGLRLDTSLQMSLAQRLRRLGQHAMADAIVARAERKAGNQVSSLFSLMTMYQSLGKSDEAKQIAYSLLQRTNPPSWLAMANSSRNPIRYQQSGDATRRQVLQFLQQTGDLKNILQQAEVQLQRSPDSLRLLEQLVEGYTAMGDKSKTGELLEKALAQKPDSSVLRLQWAKHLETSNKIKEASDQYLQLLKEKPEWMSDDFYQLRNLFQRANRLPDLVSAVKTIDVKRFRQPYYIVDLVSTLLTEDKNVDVAMELFEKVYDAFPNYRSNLMTNIRSPKLWENDRIFEIAKKSILPSESQIAVQPWSGLDQIESYSADRANSAFSRLIQSVGTTRRKAEFEKHVEEAVTRMPQWLGGKAMLGIIDLQSRRTDQGMKRLQELLEDEKAIQQVPPIACWIIGQELDQFPVSRELAIKLFELAIAPNQGARSMPQLQYSPAQRLAKLYLDAGRKEDARKVITKALESVEISNYDPQSAAGIRIENANWAAGKFLEMGFPVDAVRLYRTVMDDRSQTSLASSWNGYPTDHYVNIANRGIAKALQSLTPEAAKEAVQHLLSIPSSIAPTAPAIDLMLAVPEVKELSKKRMQSGLSDLFKTLGDSPDRIRTIDARLVELQAMRPADLSIGIVLCLFRSSNHSTEADAAIESLVKIVETQVLEEIPTGRQPNSRQRKEALPSIPLWLVARECLSRDKTRAWGETLAQRALHAAQRQASPQHAAAILLEWTDLLLQQRNPAAAEEKLNLLLALATERPKRKPVVATGPTDAAPVNTNRVPPASNNPNIVSGGTRPGSALPRVNSPTSSIPAANPAGSSRPAEIRTPENLTPPLALSQFQLAMFIAGHASNNNMPQLSRKALRDALAGGLPVEDANAATNSRTTVTAMGGGLMMPLTVSRTQSNVSIEVEVAQSVQRTIAKWQGDAYPAIEVYELMKPLVLPPSRPSEIMLFADSSQLREASVSSLGATLIHWARLADKLDELNVQIEQRKKSPNALVPSLVMQTLIALGDKQLPKAKEYIDALSQECSKPISPVLVQTACQAALASRGHPELKEASFSILKKAVELNAAAILSQANLNSGYDEFGNPISNASIGKLAELVNRYVADTGDATSVKKYFESVIASRQPNYARYNDGGISLQRQDLIAFSAEAARSGSVDLAMEFLGRSLDLQTQRLESTNVKQSLAMIARLYRGMAPEARYHAWLSWTLPSTSRQTIRFIGQQVSQSSAPEVFLRLSSQKLKPLATNYVSNWTELVEAAREAGKLEELNEQIEKLVEQDVGGAAGLMALVAMERQLAMPKKDSTDCEQSIIKATSKIAAWRKVSSSPSESANAEAKKLLEKAIPESQYVLFSACMRSDTFSNAYMKGFGKEQFSYSDLQVSGNGLLYSMAYAKRVFDQAKISFEPTGMVQLSHWIPASNDAAKGLSVSPWWDVDTDHASMWMGSGMNSLYFKYPLEGDFEVSMDTDNSAGIGYGGTLVNNQQIHSMSGGETIYRNANQRTPGSADVAKQTLVITPNDQKVVVNGALLYSEQNTKTSPWLYLSSQNSPTASFRNLVVKGTPRIPRSVSLLDGDSMDGWNCTFANETRPKKRLLAVKANENDSNYYAQQREPSVYDWECKEGHLTAEGAGLTGLARQSWIYYHRPLDRDEVFRYEYLHNEGESVAHPTLGKVAFLLEPAGPRLHWITDTSHDLVVEGIPFDNAIEVPAGMRGATALAFKNNDWNQVEVHFREGCAEIWLNGQKVITRPHESQLDTRIGIFRYSNQSCKVRNASLTGRWPTELPPEIWKRPFDTPSPIAPETRRLMNSATFDRLAPAELTDLTQAASKMSDEEGWDLLKAWVLPSESHTNFRTYYRFGTRTLNSELADSTSLRSDSIVCPAIDLVQLAGKLMKLDSLKQLILSDPTAATNPLQLRNRNAILALIAIEQRDETEARKWLAEVYKPVAKGLPKEMEMRDRSAEFIVAWHAANYPSLLPAANDIAMALTKTERNAETTSNVALWKTHLGVLTGRLSVEELKTTAASASGLIGSKQWHAVPVQTPSAIANNHRPSQWLYQAGSLQHVPAGASSMLFFQSPLQGQFEVTAQRSVFSNRDVEIGYGMQSLSPLKGKQTLSISHLLQGAREEAKSYPEPEGEVAEFRISVNGQEIKTFINGHLVYEETKASPPDPWLVLHAKQPFFAGVVRDVRITGSPAIPSQIDLIRTDRWAGWRANRFGETHSGFREGNRNDNMFNSSRNTGNEAWQNEGDEIVGRPRTDNPSTAAPSLLVYQRPMLEDGVIEWEAYYGSKDSMVHPCLGSTLCWIESRGTKTLPIDDSLYAAYPVSIENSKPVAVQDYGWNRYKLALKGDAATLFVNDEQVMEFQVSEPKNERQFGLFRFSNQYGCRVRNLVYKGAWPTTLPKLADQELAYPQGGPCGLPVESNVLTKSIAMHSSIEAIKKEGVVVSGREDQYTVTDNGLKIAMRNAATGAARPSLKIPLPKSDTFEVTVDYEDVRIGSAKQGWGTLFAVVANFDNHERSMIEGAIKMNLDGQLLLAGSNRRNQPTGTALTVETFHAPNPAKSGRLRLVGYQGQVHFLHSPEESKEFQLVYSARVGAALLNSVTIEGKASDDVGQLDVTIRNVTIRTKSD